MSSLPFPLSIPFICTPHTPQGHSSQDGHSQSHTAGRVHQTLRAGSDEGCKNCSAKSLRAPPLRATDTMVVIQEQVNIRQKNLWPYKLCFASPTQAPVQPHLPELGKCCNYLFHRWQQLQVIAVTPTMHWVVSMHQALITPLRHIVSFILR